MIKDMAWRWIDENSKHLIEFCDAIWKYAELGLVEDRSFKSAHGQVCSLNSAYTRAATKWIVMANITSGRD